MLLANKLRSIEISGFVMDIRSHNSAQSKELKRIRDEIKWLVGEKLGYDPDSTGEGRREVEEYFAGVIISGAGEWVAIQCELMEKRGKDLTEEGN